MIWVNEVSDVFALILFDQSYSTDAWLDGVRVLDVTTETILRVSEVLDDAIEKFAIAGFTSNTRHSYDIVPAPSHLADSRCGLLVRPAWLTRGFAPNNMRRVA